MEEENNNMASEPEKVTVWPKEEHVKEKPKSKKSSAHKKDRFWKITTVVLIVILAFFLWKGGPSNITGGTTADAGDSGDTEVVPTRDIAELVDDDPFLGDANAPVVIVEFSDYECPFCGKFYQETLPLIKSEYIDTGKVKFVYRDFPLSFHQQAEPAAIATNCAEKQGKYWEFHNLVYTNQQSLSASTYEQWATDLGLDVGDWKACLTNPQQKAEVQKDMQDGIAAGVRGTPAFFINGKLLSGAQPFTIFQQAIKSELS